MKIAYQHLLKFLDEKPSIEDLSNKLFQLGHEHETFDSIFDMEFTPNRGDCLSLQGLARDLNVFYNTKIDLPIFNKDLSTLDLNFINNVGNKCPQISFLNIQIKGNVSEYKDYLQDYFTDLGINKNNFFADVSNYIGYEMGQPTHCYDFSKIGSELTLKENTINTKFTTLLGNDIQLNGSDLVFTSKQEIVNLSGIIGGLSTACSKKTTNTLIECAYFKPESIIGKAVKYNLHSDASHKFERGTDPKCHEKVLRRFIQIVSDHAEIIKVELLTCDNDHYEEIELDFDINRVNRILGTEITEGYYKDSMIKLGFKIDKSITVPSYRSDISHQNDLAEELARVIGYDNIPVKSLHLNVTPYKLDASNENKLKIFLANNGFSEVVNSPFCPEGNPHSIKIDNPLDSNREYLRTNLTESLLENLIYNEKRQKDSIKFYEISDIYTLNKNKNTKKEKKLAIIISGRRGLNYLEFSQRLDDKYLENLLRPLTDINLTKKIISIDRNNINSKIKTPIFVIELKISDLMDNLDAYVTTSPIPKDFINYKKISEFPCSYRDLSFSLKDSKKIIQITKILSSHESDIIKSSFMFDFFNNEKTNEIKIGYRFIFQSQHKTLTDPEIDNEINKLVKQVTILDSVSLPGAL